MVKQGYKQTEIGLIPEDWEYDFAGAYLDFLTGFPFKSDGFSKQGTKLLRGSNVKRNEIVWNEDLNRYWENIDHSLTKYLLKEDDIVISMDGSLVGRSFGQISKSDLPCLLVQRVARVRGVKIHTNYLKQYYCSEFFTTHCDNNKTSSAIPHISPKDILEFKIAFPKSLPEQEAIASALSDADAWIESLEQLIAKKRLIKQGAMQELLTPKEDWEVKKLGEVGKFQSGWGFPIIYQGEKNGNIPFFKVSDLNNLGNEKFLTISNNYISENTSAKISKELIKKRSIVFAKIGAAVFLERKRILFQDSLIDNNMCSYYTDNIDSNYLYYYFLNINLSDFVSTSALPSLSTNDLNQIQINYPKSLSEQTRIATILSDMDAELEALEQKLSKARQIKQGMMQELLTGRVRLVS